MPKNGPLLIEKESRNVRNNYCNRKKSVAQNSSHLSTDTRANMFNSSAISSGVAITLMLSVILENPSLVEYSSAIVSVKSTAPSDSMSEIDIAIEFDNISLASRGSENPIAL